MKKAEKIIAVVLLGLLCLASVVLSYIKNHVPDGLELREFIYNDWTVIVYSLWIAATIYLTSVIIRGIGRTGDVEAPKAAPVLGISIVAVIVILILGSMILANVLFNGMLGTETVNPDGTITVKKDCFPKEITTELYEKEGLLYRKKL
ncbi:hypothetical protein D6853_01725 [Butyrivibrio sp. X503]|uniref:hypothetical protein n=1 Tax=Butyrivibrio sp. X503 TaxID=2364878 RepID=UPI000EAA87D6|nr:hypothetical protein [Butyrivibrio sp. X503]RKM58276.1 hypothetical protein D6853_01725 [Butyrivibrio sp. X503]